MRLSFGEFLLALICGLAIAVIVYIGYEKYGKKSLSQPVAQEASVATPTKRPQVSAPPAPPPIPSQISAPAIAPAVDCKTAKPTEYLVTLPELQTEIAKGKRSLQLDGKGGCYRVGSKVSLVIQGIEPGIFGIRGTATVKSVSPNGLVGIDVDEFHYGVPAVVAPVCFGYCDEVLMALPSNVKAHHVHVSQSRDSKLLKDKSWQNVKSSVSTFTSQSIFERLSAIKGETFIVAGDGPQWMNRSILHVMKGLKERGAAKVSWLYYGVFSIENRPFFPPIPNGVQRAELKDLKSLLEKGARPIYVEDRNARDAEIPGSISVEIKNVLSPPATLPPSAKEIAEAAKSFNLSGLPLHKVNTYIVYGENYVYWGPYFLLLDLQSRGFTKLYVLQDGAQGYRAGERLRIVK